MRRMRHLKAREIQGCVLALDASRASSLYDATSGGSLVAPDGAIARWEDQSGNANHATQGTLAYRPLRKTTIWGGLDIARFDGSFSSMNHGASSGVDPNTLTVVGIRRAAQSSYRVMLTYGTAANNGAIFNMRGPTDRMGSFTTAEVTSTFSVPIGSAFVGSQIDNSGIYWTANGAQVGSAAGNAATQSLAVVGAGTGFHCQMDFGEAIVHNRAVAISVLRRLHHSRMRKWRVSG